MSSVCFATIRLQRPLILSIMTCFFCDTLVMSLLFYRPSVGTYPADMNLPFLYMLNTFFPLCPFSLLHTTYGLLWFDLFACLDWMDFYWYLVRISYSYAPFFRKLGRYSVLILLTVYLYIWQLKWALNLFTMHRFIKIYCWNAASLQSVHILHLVICLY